MHESPKDESKWYEQPPVFTSEDDTPNKPANTKPDRRALIAIAVIVGAAVLAAVLALWLIPSHNTYAAKPAYRAPVSASAKPSPTQSAPNSVTTAQPRLSVGATGSAVTELQNRLNVWNVQPQLAVDGAFGNGTKAAVKAFQSASGIVPDGVVGPNTWTALDATPVSPMPILYSVPVPVTAPTSMPMATTADIKVGVKSVGGTAGAFFYDLVFTNTSNHSVTMFGFPGVSAALSNGMVIGSPATRFSTTPKTITLAPGDVAFALLKVPDAGAFDTTALQENTSELVVFIPGAMDSVNVPLTLTVITPKVPFMVIYPVSSEAT